MQIHEITALLLLGFGVGYALYRAVGCLYDRAHAHGYNEGYRKGKADAYAKYNVQRRQLITLEKKLQGPTPTSSKHKYD